MEKDTFFYAFLRVVRVLRVSPCRAFGMNDATGSAPDLSVIGIPAIMRSQGRWGFIPDGESMAMSAQWGGNE